MTTNDELVVIVRELDVVVERAGGLFLGRRDALPAFADSPVFLGRFEDRGWYAARARRDVELPAELAFASVRSLFSELPEPTLHILGIALAGVEFAETHRHCGRCGTATEPGAAAPDGHEPSAGAQTRRCPSCGLSAHPRIAPAVIVLVEREDRVLLARSARFPPGRFSAVAGFVEIGESLEQAAAREVGEEVGVQIRGLKYFGSQPWPFGRSLMIGFSATYAGGSLTPDGHEIVEADWFSRDRLPDLPPKVSIARRLIDAFVARATPRA
ncbi:NAD(+) diphosphatase [Sorangium sp. So ce1153]|uniref:NAD(+) diphosphatase n=1 Tax=Sorangium sp. So ce1153 TaxID=3133333 RepID=UPI003F5D5CE5